MLTVVPAVNFASVCGYHAKYNIFILGCVCDVMLTFPMETGIARGAKIIKSTTRKVCVYKAGVAAGYEVVRSLPVFEGVAGPIGPQNVLVVHTHRTESIRQP